MTEKKKWPIKVSLKHPIMVIRVRDEEEVEEELKVLQLKQLKGKHLKYVPAEMKDAYFVVPLIAALTGITKDEAGEMDIEDVLSIAEILIPFLERLPGTGKK